jgi:hypothetical protein
MVETVLEKQSKSILKDKRRHLRPSERVAWVTDLKFILDKVKAELTDLRGE